MKKNVGSIDKGVRIVIIAAGVFFTGTVTGVLGYVALGVAAIMLATTFMSSCPIYSILGMNSCPMSDKK